MSLMQEILNTPVRTDELLLCFLGQNGFVLRTTDLSLGVDLYLSNSCADDEEITRVLGVRLDRLLPIFISPRDLNLDLILATHEHKDHADPETLVPIQANKTQFVGPRPVMKLLSDVGISSSRCVELNEGQTRRFCSVTVQSVFARYVSGSVGFFLEAGGLRIYVTGDSEFDERLCAVAGLSPDLMLVCINGRWGNMSSAEAVELTRRVRPTAVAPTHYDMFAANSADPNAFVEAVSRDGGGCRPRIFEPGRIYRLSRATL